MEIRVDRLKQDSRKMGWSFIHRVKLTANIRKERSESCELKNISPRQTLHVAAVPSLCSAISKRCPWRMQPLTTVPSTSHLGAVPKRAHALQQKRMQKNQGERAYPVRVSCSAQLNLPGLAQQVLFKSLYTRPRGLTDDRAREPIARESPASPLMRGAQP